MLRRVRQQQLPVDRPQPGPGQPPVRHAQVLELPLLRAPHRDPVRDVRRHPQRHRALLRQQHLARLHRERRHPHPLRVQRLREAHRPVTAQHAPPDAFRAGGVGGHQQQPAVRIGQQQPVVAVLGDAQQLRGLAAVLHVHGHRARAARVVGAVERQQPSLLVQPRPAGALPREHRHQLRAERPAAHQPQRRRVLARRQRVHPAAAGGRGQQRQPLALDGAQGQFAGVGRGRVEQGEVVTAVRPAGDEDAPVGERLERGVRLLRLCGREPHRVGLGAVQRPALGAPSAVAVAGDQPGRVGTSGRDRQRRGQ